MNLDMPTPMTYTLLPGVAIVWILEERAVMELEKCGELDR